MAVAGLTAAVEKTEPEAAKTAAAPARDRQIAYVRRIQASGGQVGTGFSVSEYFAYLGYTDARVDVENRRGYDLRE